MKDMTIETEEFEFDYDQYLSTLDIKREEYNIECYQPTTLALEVITVLSDLISNTSVESMGDDIIDAAKKKIMDMLGLIKVLPVEAEGV